MHNLSIERTCPGRPLVSNVERLLSQTSTARYGSLCKSLDSDPRAQFTTMCTCHEIDGTGLDSVRDSSRHDLRGITASRSGT